MSKMLTAKQVREIFNISDMTLWNWLKNENMDFPQPIRIRSRRYFEVDKIEAFKNKAANQEDTTH